MGLLSVNFDHTVMMGSDLSTFLPTLGLLGAVLKKIRLRTHKKHKKTQKIYSKDRWHCSYFLTCLLAMPFPLVVSLLAKSNSYRDRFMADDFMILNKICQAKLSVCLVPTGLHIHCCHNVSGQGDM